MASDYMLLSEFFLDELPEEHPWRGNIKGLIEKLLAAGVTFKRDPYKPFTNGDKIRAMSDAELAGFLAGKFTDFSTYRKMDMGETPTATAISAESHLWFTTWIHWLRMSVEVVRCKDCKHCYKSTSSSTNYRCKVLGVYDTDCEVTPEHFCSYGERKDNDI